MTCKVLANFCKASFEENQWVDQISCLQIFSHSVYVWLLHRGGEFVTPSGAIQDIFLKVTNVTRFCEEWWFGLTCDV